MLFTSVYIIAQCDNDNCAKVSAMRCGSIGVISQLSLLRKGFKSLDSQGKASLLLGSEVWEENFST